MNMVDSAQQRRRGRLRVYLGAAPGVGKTYAMLSEAHRRRERGTDVVAGLVEDHGRPRTAALLAGLETVPRRAAREDGPQPGEGPGEGFGEASGGGAQPGAEQGELDCAAVLERRPDVVLVDDLAHTNAPGARHRRRWQDVEELLAAGVDVVTTVDIEHLESLGDVVESITGVRPADTVPDELVRRADQIELVDMDPEALRRRMAHGDIYPSERVDAALSHYFRPGNLTALRELALLWTADRVDEHLRRYRSEHRIRATWQARERIVVGLTGGPEGRTLIRRAARMAAQGSGGEILAVHIARAEGRTARSPGELAVQRALVEDLGGTYHHVLGEDVPAALLDFARGVNATQIVLGSPRRRGLRYPFGPGTGASVARDSGPDLDVHIVTHEHTARGPVLPGLPAARRSRLGRSRRIAGWLTAFGAPGLLTLLLGAFDPDLGFVNDVLFFLVLTVAAGLVGGLLPAVASAAVCSVLLNYFFTRPAHTWTISDPRNMVSLTVFLGVAVAVASVVDLAARRTHQAMRLRAESEILSVLAGSALRGEDSLEALLERVRETFAVDAVALLERADGRDAGAEPDDAQLAHGDGESGGPRAGEGPQAERSGGPGGWVCAAAAGRTPAPARGAGPPSPEDGDVAMPVGDRMVLVLYGRVLPASDRRVLAAYAAQAAGAVDRQRLLDEAERARELAEANRIRTALLAAVSHDLRTPLAAIKASVTSLRADDVEWSPEDEAQLLGAIEEGADRLDGLVGNLLDMSRLQTGTVAPLIREMSLEEVVPRALHGVQSGRAGGVRLVLGEALPLVAVDPGLAERAVANIVENALAHSPPGKAVLVKASALDDRVEVRVMDRGPGVPDSAKGRIFEPFQRYGDAPAGSGVGLGLAVARGFAEAMGGGLDAEDTPGGGLTMVLTLRAAHGRAPGGRRTDRAGRTDRGAAAGAARPHVPGAARPRAPGGNRAPGVRGR